MNKHKMFFLFVSIGLLTIFLLTACGLTELNYQGKLRTVYEVEEMLSDYLESENPDLDLDVRITEDMD